MDQIIRKKLDRITNILFGGGVNNPITYIEQISYLIYLKLLDEAENERELHGKLTNGNGKRLFPGQSERYRWSKWRFNSGEKLRNFLRDDVFPYMSTGLLKDEPQIAEYFRDAVLEIVDPNVLKQVIDEIDAINFRRLGPDEKGDIFEYLLNYLGQSALLGQFRTPRQIRSMMVELIDPDFGDTIYDPACGTGGFLIDSLEYVLAKYSEKPKEIPIYGEEWLLQKYITKQGNGTKKTDEEEEIEVPKNFLKDLKKDIPNLQTYRKGNGDKIPNWELLEGSLYGIDVSRQMMRIATMNMVLHGVPKSNIKRANTLSDLGGLSDEDLKRKYKVILSNPPFAGVLPQDSIRKDLPTNSKKSELLFLGVMMEALAPGGRCAIVVPEGLLFGATAAHIELRRKLVEEFDLLAVISLPAGVFKPYAGVKTGILVFHKPKSEKKKDVKRKTWFYEIKNDGFDPDKITGGGRPQTPEQNDIPDFISQWKKYKTSDYENPPGIEANSILPAGSEEPTCWYATFEIIEESDFILTAGKYKPRIVEKGSDEDPTELVRKSLKIEKEIVDGLNNLLDEIGKLE